MDISDKGILEIAEHEGIVPAPYLDSVDVWTYGVGHTHAAGGIDPAMMDPAMPANIDAAVKDAVALFRVDLQSYVERVNNALRVEVNQHEFDALVSFDFNTGGINRANLTKQLNAGSRTKAAAAFMGWLRPPEIRKRRTAEMNLFITGDYDANGSSIPVWKTNGKGKLIGVVKTIDGKDLLKRMGRKPVKPAKPSPIAAVTGAGGLAVVGAWTANPEYVPYAAAVVVVAIAVFLIYRRMK